MQHQCVHKKTEFFELKRGVENWMHFFYINEQSIIWHSCQADVNKTDATGWDAFWGQMRPQQAA